MKRTLSLSEISRHRAFLYGFAAAWILFFHMVFVLPEHPFLAPLRWLKNHGNCGVDIFSMLSAMGLYHSLEKDSRLLPFYRRRLLRVFLPMFIVTAVYYGVVFSGTGQYLKKLLVMPYWFGVGSFWYAPYILTMYLVYPAIHRLQKKSPWFPAALLILSLIFPFWARHTAPDWAQHCEHAISRIPVFLAGCILAPYIHRGAKVPLWILPFLLLPAVLLERLQLWPLNRYAYIFLAAFAIACLTLLAPLFTRGAVRRLVYRSMAFLGGLSLEVYLIQVRLSNLLARHELYASQRESLYKLEIFNTIATLLLAVLLHRLCRTLVREFSSVKIPDTD